MISQVYWTEEYPLGKTYNVSTELPDKVDFVIIGSGYTGLTAARVLAKADSSVAVFDEKKIGWGASSRNGGMATPGLKQDIFKIYKKYGIELNFKQIQQLLHPLIQYTYNAIKNDS